MKKKYPISRFKKWRNNFVDNLTLKPVTDSALLTRDELQTFLAEMPADADSVRIYFLRFQPNIDEPQIDKIEVNGGYFPGCTWITAGSGLSQIAIALTPTRNLSVDPKTYEMKAEDIIVDESITLLIPGKEVEGPTGHNPPPSTIRFGG